MTGGAWSDWRLARRLRVTLVGLFVLLLLAGVALTVALRRADEATSEQVERTVPARLAASQLLTSLVDQETGLRGYALSGDEAFLEPYRQGLLKEERARRELGRLIRPGDDARVDLLSVDAAITAWRGQYASLRTDSAEGPGVDRTIEFGRQLFERVRRSNAALDAELEDELTTAQEEADRARTVVVVTLALMALTVAVAVAALSRALSTSVLRPLRRLGEQVRVVARGGHGVPIQPTGPPDLREIGDDVESMRLELVGVLAEVEQQRRGLERRAAELARSNADLEQFAYVASHDLQEPLRKVASFCQLLEQRYAGQLDDRADQYIAFAVDGAKRMQLLITDLLTFSRVGRTSEGFVAVDLVAVAATAWETLEDQARSTGATLDVDVVPGAAQIHGDPALLRMLLTNLFANSLKYRRPDEAPSLRLTAAPEGEMVRVDVADNGIGIPDEYAQKVFVIFQRLHGRDEYGGTGIGLALAKKVVEFHGGTIEVRASQSGGTCMSFTLPPEETATDV
ncbi:histidine kinase [Nocardioides sp. HDW12B]|uniref:sensor histidine kinase n=1 Tax=Nocardioides sp. HDW12B TaxID=2714939 RepID=UPI0014093B03|nr:sensor histidine kinase [Nocardioides sp. HDW12B]QIK66783.1 histidine kinase [Nocardioides sp. HDW12B]